MKNLAQVDDEIYQWILAEDRRQLEKIELIASENFISEAVLETAGSCLTNKYAEGYPNRRYYGGCEYVDKIEEIAIKRVKELFQAEHANVQPHSGSQANTGVYFAAADPGGTILGMDLTHGGHLTHGSRVNFSGRYYNFVHYGVTKDEELIDYQQVEQLAKEHRPQIIVAGGSAYPRFIDFERFSQIANEVGAKLMVDMAHFAGLVAAKLFPNPVPHSDFVTSTTHKTLRGTRGGLILCKEEYAKDIDKAIFPGIQGGPLMHIIAAKAVTFKEAMEESFIQYQKQVLKNATRLAEALKRGGLRLVSGGTDTHLILVDLTPISLTGKEAEERLDLVGITVNKNTIPFEKQKPMITSGIRIGAPAVTTRGMKEEEMDRLGDLIVRTLKEETSIDDLKAEVKDLTSRFPKFLA